MPKSQENQRNTRIVTPKKLFEDMDKFIEANKDFKFDCPQCSAID